MSKKPNLILSKHNNMIIYRLDKLDKVDKNLKKISLIKHLKVLFSEIRKNLLKKITIWKVEQEYVHKKFQICMFFPKRKHLVFIQKVNKKIIKQKNQDRMNHQYH